MPCSLELRGGRNPFIVLDDADTSFLPRPPPALMYTNAARCAWRARLLVHQRIAEAFVQQLHDGDFCV